MTARIALRALARAWGIQTAYRDIEGRRHVASDEALVAVLRALGARVAGPADAVRALAERRAMLDARRLEPVLVAWDGRLPAFTLGAARPARRLRCRLVLEDGAERAWDVGPDSLAEAPASGGRALRVAPGGVVPAGRHRLVVEGAGPAAETHVLAAPRHVWSLPAGHRTWGVFAPVYGLHSPTSLGVGDLGDLDRLAGQVGDLGGDLVGTLPLLAAFLDEPFDPSPYAPVSRLFWNELYVDVGTVPELEDAPAAQRLLASDGVRRTVDRLGRGRLVDPREAMRLKRRVLEILAATPARPERRRALAAWLAANPRARDYARFRAAVERRGTGWPAWRGAARDGRLGPRDVDPARVRYHCWVQWIADTQLAAVGDTARARPVGLYLDLPLGVSGGGYDTWRERDAFALAVDAGAPPDPFFSKGQSWGFPPLHPERIRETGYGYPAAYLRHHMRAARVLRLDHVMGLHRLYWVPHGFEAAEGVYVRYRPDEAYALVSLESHRSRCAVVGENLGTVPAAVNAAMARHHLLYMHVLQYEIRPERTPPLRPAPPRALACLNTHDMPPFAGWWAARDVEDRRVTGLLRATEAAAERRGRAAARRALVRMLRRAGALDPGRADAAAVLRACLAFLAAGPADVLLVSLEDLWLEERPQNVPGTTGDANWRGRLRLGLERLARDGRVRDTLRRVAEARELRQATGHEK